MRAIIGQDAPFLCDPLGLIAGPSRPIIGGSNPPRSELPRGSIS